MERLPSRLAAQPPLDLEPTLTKGVVMYGASARGPQHRDQGLPVGQRPVEAPVRHPCHALGHLLDERERLQTARPSNTSNTGSVAEVISITISGSQEQVAS